MRSIILSAGKSTRFFSGLESAKEERIPHKSLFANEGVSILRRQIDALAAIGCHSNNIVFSGNKEDWSLALSRLGLLARAMLIENKDAEKYGSYKSIYEAINKLETPDDTIILEGDIWINDINYFVKDFEFMLNYPNRTKVLAYKNPRTKTGVYLTINPFDFNPSYYYDQNHGDTIPKNSVESCQIWFISKSMWKLFQFMQSEKDFNDINWKAFDGLAINVVQATRDNYININSIGDFYGVCKCANSR